MDIRQTVWGFTPQDEAVILYTMTNAGGAQVELTNFGAAIVAIKVPDKQGVIGDVALGYTKWQDYVSDGPAAGKSVGRYANRIARGHFVLDDKEYNLAINNGPNHLHGGPTGFQNRVWGARVEGDRVVFSFVSDDGQEGYPGTLTVEACFDWDDDCNLEITYFARSDAKTIVNLTNHVYFNLTGDGSGSVDDHVLQLNASHWLPTDATLIPTGEIASVDGTPMDFRSPHSLGERIDDDFQALQFGKGYDHCWVLDDWRAGRLTPAGELYSPVSGRCVLVSTTQPGIQIYTGNWLEGSPQGHNGPYHDRWAVAMECQGWPDSPNHDNFPSQVLEADQTYQQHIVYSFSTK
ncbi:MAG: aldose epimerase family protein [Mucinivorans sp.]